MSDEQRQPNLRTGWQEHDVWYVVDRVQDEYWEQSWHLIQQVLAVCKDEVKPSEGREKLLEVAKEKMALIVRSQQNN